MTNPCHHMQKVPTIRDGPSPPPLPRCKSGPACPWFPAYAAFIVECLLAMQDGVERGVPKGLEREALAFVQEARVQKGASA